MEEYKSEKNLSGLYQKALGYEKMLNDRPLEAILGETKRRECMSRCHGRVYGPNALGSLQTIIAMSRCHGRVYGDYHNSCCKYLVA